MNEPISLAGFVELASRRHNGASGRRLAEIAARDGFDISHSTLNRIRRGTYGSVPTEAVLKAIAHLAEVPEDVVVRATDASSGRRPEAIFDDWQRARAKSLNLELEYAILRDIPVDAAERELSDVLQMIRDAKMGRPWTPPWNPGPAFGPDDEPWKSEWWAVDEPMSAADRFEELGIGTPERIDRLRASGEVVHRIGLGWTDIDKHGGLEGFVAWKNSQHNASEENDSEHKDAGDRPSPTAQPRAQGEADEGEKTSDDAEDRASRAVNNIRSDPEQRHEVL